MQLTHVRILVDDLKAAHALYGQQMQPAVWADGDRFYDYGLIMLKAPPVSLNLVDRERGHRSLGPELLLESPTLVFSVDDVDREVARFPEVVVPPYNPPTRAGTLTCAQVRDPDGTLVELRHVELPNAGMAGAAP
jgi:catechol 2,3-dioxygenase-like lactoylglutathione lyase family enzyme